MNSIKIFFDSVSVILAAYVTTSCQNKTYVLGQEVHLKSIPENIYIFVILLRLIVTKGCERLLYCCVVILRTSYQRKMYILPTHAEVTKIRKDVFGLVSNEVRKSSNFSSVSTCLFQDLICPAPIPYNAIFLKATNSSCHTDVV
jgi:hypothetical protein